MKQAIMILLSILWGFSSGMILATAIVAFITTLGLIPRLTAKTNTRTHFLAMGTAVVLGSTVGNLLYITDVQVPLPKTIIGIFSLLIGIYVGCLAIALAEILNIIPISKSRLKLKKGMRIIIFIFSLGKMVGSLYYWFYPAFIFKH